MLHFKYYTKTITLNFSYRYQSIKKPSCKCVRYNKYGIKIVQNLSTGARHRICNYYDIDVTTLCDN